MPMLDLDHVRAGTLEDARIGSVLLPVGDYSADFLVAEGGGGELFGVFLSGDYRFDVVMASQDGENWSGFFVDDVRIEVDLSSVEDAGHRRPSVGSVVSRPSGVFLVAWAGGRPGLRRRVELGLKRGAVGTASTTQAVAFSRWTAVKGEGPSRVVLRDVQALAET